MLLKFHGHCKYPSSHIPLLFSCPEATAVYSHNWEQRFLAPMQSSTHPEKYFLTINKKKIMFFFFKLSQSEYGMHLYNTPRAGGYYWNKFYFFGEVEDNSEEKKCLNVRQKLETRNSKILKTWNSLTLSLAHSPALSLFHSLIHSLSTYWTTFVFMSMLKSHILTFSHSLTLTLSHSLILSFTLSWHAEQFLFSCLCS